MFPFTLRFYMSCNFIQSIWTLLVSFLNKPGPCLSLSLCISIFFSVIPLGLIILGKSSPPILLGSWVPTKKPEWPCGMVRLSIGRVSFHRGVNTPINPFTCSWSYPGTLLTGMTPKHHCSPESSSKGFLSLTVFLSHLERFIFWYLGSHQSN